MMSVAGALAALLAAGFFSLAELVIISVSRLRLRHWVRQTMHDSGWLAADAVDQPYRLLQPILVGHTLAVTSAAMFVASVLASDGRWADAPLAMAGWTALVLVPPLYLIGEIVPRAIAGARAHQIFAPVVVILRGCSWLFRPVIGVADRLTRLALRWLGAVAERPAAFGRRSLESLLVESERVGLVEAEERRIIAGVFAFGQTPVAAVMTPLERMATAPAAATAGEMAALIRETGYSRIPLHGRTPRDILGMVHVFDLFTLAPEARPRGRPVISVGPATLCDALLIDMKRRRCHLAIVVEGGRALGMVTMEDLVEELVGEIRDEHDEVPVDKNPDRVDDAETVADIPRPSTRDAAP